MSLCDRLEAARDAREATRDRLRRRPSPASTRPIPETFQDDARFALDNVAVLTARPDQIKPFGQTILNLAVRGKLVPQDPKDEPASELLKRIAAEKVRLGIKTAGSALEPEEIPFELPTGWGWRRFRGGLLEDRFR